MEGKVEGHNIEHEEPDPMSLAEQGVIIISHLCLLKEGRGF